MVRADKVKFRKDILQVKSIGMSINTKKENKKQLRVLNFFDQVHVRTNAEVEEHWERTIWCSGVGGGNNKEI